MARESRYSIEPQRVVFRETFNSEFDVRRNEGTPTDVTFSNGEALPTTSLSQIQYDKFIHLTGSLRIKIYFKVDGTTERYIFDSRFDGGINIGDGHLYILSGASVITVSFGVSYVNGVQTTSLIPGWNEIIISGTVINTTKLYLFRHHTLSTRRWNNYIDLFEIYNYSLSAEEVKNLYEGKRFRALVSPTEILNVNALSGSIDDGYVVSDVFISTWKTDNAGSSGDTQIALPLEVSGIYDFSVDWGDGNSDIITVWNQAETTHTYAGTGTYTVGISGVIKGWRFNNGGDRSKILTIENWGDLLVGNSGDYFFGCSKLTAVNATDVLDLSSVTDFRRFFGNCNYLVNVDVSTFDVSGVTTLYGMFAGCSLLTALDVSGWDVSSVTNCYAVFMECSVLTNIDVSLWEVGNVTTFENCFDRCLIFTTLDVSDWDVSKVTKFLLAFNLCEALVTLDVSNWDVSSVTNFSSAFKGCATLTALDVSLWNVGNVTTFYATFEACSSLTALDVSGWNVANVTNFRWVFYDCISIISLNVSTWNTGNVTTFAYAFKNIGITVLAADNWNITSVTDMTEMFLGVILTTVNYDAILIAWEGQAVQNNVSFHAGANTKYTGGGAAEAARTALINDHSWTIIDGGGI